MSTMEKELKHVVEIAEREGWTIDLNAEMNECEVKKFSPAGQDFFILIKAKTSDEFLKELRERHDSYDPSEEAYVWLGPDGHGENGAPHDMRDLYDDMEACKEMMLELIAVLVEEL